LLCTLDSTRFQMGDGQVYFTFIEKIHFYIEHIFHFYNCTFSQEGTIIMLFL
jgi:hypothetical protein